MKNFTADAQNEKKIKFRLCPIMNENYDRLFMKNDQPHTVERKYVTIKIRKCSEMIDGDEEFPPASEKEAIETRGRVCKNKTEIQDLLDNLVFTYYMATGVA